MNDVLWWVFFAVSLLLGFMYSVGLYFTYFDDPKEFEKNFNNAHRGQFGGLSKREVREAQKLSRDIKEHYQAPTENAAYKEARAKKLRS
jgi:hypothetical protein